MNRKKIDNRIRVLIENCVTTSHRSFFIIVGEKGRDQVPIFYHMLTKAAVRSRPDVLWCFKKKPQFTTHTKKLMKRLKKKSQNGTLDLDEDSPFELFVASTKIRYCYFHETHKILGQTFGMLIIQDFEALTPNLLARTIETVEGGGTIVILLESLTSLKQLYTLSMDVHARYRTEAHQDVVCRFNERLILSLPSCGNCLVVDDKFNILPISSNAANMKLLPPKRMDDPKSPSEQQLADLKDSYQDTQPVGVLVNLCKTLDQAKAVIQFIDALSEKTLRTTVTLTSARGRGKSAALGLAISGAVAFSYSNIFITSPSPENVKTVFAFILKGFEALGYEDHTDYEVSMSQDQKLKNTVVKIQVLRDHRQTVQYILPQEVDKLGQAELVVIDEAAAIPLPYVKSLLGPYLVFMSSTINGYEGTGRSLSLKLINQLREQAASFKNSKSEHLPVGSVNSPIGRTLHEVTLHESIRYGSGDSVEAWLNQLLCLDATVVSRMQSEPPDPKLCQLYYISRDTLFSYHKAAEKFLQRIVALFVASHYKNSPDDLLMMSDAPAHHLFCLLPPLDTNTRMLPEVLCVIQVCLEGKISKGSVIQELSHGRRSAGDLIPWTISQQFQDPEFASLSGARVVRIATHPDYQRKGYGLRAFQLLQEFYEGKIPITNEVSENVTCENIEEEESTNLLEERLEPRKSLPPMLLKLSEKRPESLDYIGVSYGITEGLLSFWQRAGFVPIYLRQIPNDLTGEHSCIMLKALDNECVSSSWLPEFFVDFCERYVSLLGYQFKAFLPKLALQILKNANVEKTPSKVLTKEELNVHISPYSIRRLEMYSKNQMDYYHIMDLVPAIAKLYFLCRLGVSTPLRDEQAHILLCMGLQYKTVDQISKETKMAASEVLALFRTTVRYLIQCVARISDDIAVKELPVVPEYNNKGPMKDDQEQVTCDEEMTEAAQLKLKEDGLQDANSSKEECLPEGKETVHNSKNIQEDEALNENLSNKRTSHIVEFSCKKQKLT